jgi:hypothetical protein
MKNKKFHTFESFPKSDRKIAERGTIDTSKLILKNKRLENQII